MPRRVKRLLLAAATALILLALAATAHAAVQPRTLQSGILTVEFWPGDEQLAQQSLDILEHALEEFALRLPAGRQPIRVTICRSLREFRVRAGQYGRTWISGVSKSHEGLIAVKAPYLLPPQQDYRGLLRHELLHVLLARNTDEANMPRWLNEGTVMVLSRENRWGSLGRVGRMYATGNLIPYYRLDFAFLPLGDEVLTSDAYAQALSMTRFLRDRIGEEAFWDFILAMRHQPFETALAQAADLTPGGFVEQWRRSLWVFAVVATLGSAFTAFNLMVMLLFLAWYVKRRRNIAILEQWEQEEADELHLWQNEYVSPDEWTDDPHDRRAE